jgi:hypothetical protein
MLLALDAANERNRCHNCQDPGRPEEQSFRMRAQMPLLRRFRAADRHGFFPSRGMFKPTTIKNCASSKKFPVYETRRITPPRNGSRGPAPLSAACGKKVCPAPHSTAGELSIYSRAPSVNDARESEHAMRVRYPPRIPAIRTAVTGVTCGHRSVQQGISAQAREPRGQRASKGRRKLQ